MKQDGSWDFGKPTAINRAGEIAGMGLRNGRSALYLLTPLKQQK